ncbi:MAG: GAF domain-containing protein [Acidimicrobiia bacterium]
MTAPISFLRPSSVELALKRRLVEQESLVALSQVALEGGDVYALMQVAAERLAVIESVEFVSVLEWMGDESFVIRGMTGDPGLVGTEIGDLHQGTTAGQAVASGKTVLVENLSADPQFAGANQLRERGMVSGMTVPIPARQGTWGVLGVWTSQERRFNDDDSHFVEAVAALIGWVVARGEVESRLAEAVRDKDRRLRTESALAWCAQSLLGDFDTEAIETSLRALMQATNSSFGFIDWFGASGSLPSIRLGRSGGSQELNRHWEKVSWDNLPTLRDQLRAGETVVFRVSDLPVGEATPFLTAPEMVATEIDVPILVKSRWIGTLGLGDRDDRRQWDSDEVKAIELGASLLAAWWERRDYAHQLEEAIEFRNRRIKLEQSIASAAQFLSRSANPEDLETALSFLLDGTDASAVFVERNVEHPELGLCSKVIAVAKREGASSYEPSYWDMMPWERMPVSYAALSKGKEVVVTPEGLVGPEALTYAASEVKSEIDVPIMIEGSWVGLIGLADERSFRDWSEETQMLHTAADMIAAFWARLDSASRLEELVRSKDDFIASISHELRTPLTAVVGLAETISNPDESLGPAETAELIGIIAEQSSEMAAIVQDLLVVARSNTGQVTIRAETLDLHDQTLQAKRGVRFERNRHIELEGSATAYADAVRVRQIIRNLLVNAGRYGGPRIRVRLEGANNFSLIHVGDDGPGIPMEDRERVFQPYERAHQRFGQPASVGLGLTVSRQLAQLMGGWLTYRFEDNWSTFTLGLPALEPPESPFP